MSMRTNPLPPSHIYSANRSACASQSCNDISSFIHPFTLELGVFSQYVLASQENAQRALDETSYLHPNYHAHLQARFLRRSVAQKKAL
jgi:hypothetical protein